MARAAGGVNRGRILLVPDVPLSTVISAFLGLAGVVGTLFKLYVDSLRERAEKAEKRADTAEEEADKRAAAAVAKAEKERAEMATSLATERAERLAYVEKRREESELQRQQLFDMVENLHQLGKAATRGAFGSSPTGTGGRGGGGSGPVPTRPGPGTR